MAVVGVCIADAKFETWQQTNALRFLRDDPNGVSMKLQQAWRCLETGEQDWRDVPVVIATA